MARRKIAAGTTSLTLPLFVSDSSSTTGAGLVVAYNSAGLVAEYRKAGQSTWTAITPVAGTLGTYTSGGIAADGALAGAIELGVPDGALAGATWSQLRLRGVANMLPVLIELELDQVNYQDAQHFGLAALPATGTLAVNPTLASGGLDAVPGLGALNFRRTVQAVGAFLFGVRSGVPAAGTAGTVTYGGSYGTVTVDTAGNITASAMTPPA